MYRLSRPRHAAARQVESQFFEEMDSVDAHGHPMLIGAITHEFERLKIPVSGSFRSIFLFFSANFRYKTSPLRLACRP